MFKFVVCGVCRNNVWRLANPAAPAGRGGWSQGCNSPAAGDAAAAGRASAADVAGCGRGGHGAALRRPRPPGAAALGRRPPQPGPQGGLSEFLAT